MLSQDVIATSTSRAVDGFWTIEACSTSSGASNPESLRVARWCELGLLSSGVLSEVTSKPCLCGVTGSTLCRTAMLSRSIELVYIGCGSSARRVWELVIGYLVALSESGEYTTLMNGLLSLKPSLRWSMFFEITLSAINALL